jgi:hypothetical protein
MEVLKARVTNDFRITISPILIGKLNDTLSKLAVTEIPPLCLIQKFRHKRPCLIAGHYKKVPAQHGSIHDLILA